MKQEDGTILSIYSHSDGYPSYQGDILLKHWQDPEKIKSMLAEGDMSMLGEELGEKHPFQPDYNDPNGVDTWEATYGTMCRFYARDRGDGGTKALESVNERALISLANNGYEEFVYLWKDGKWYYTPTKEDAVFVELTSEVVETDKLK